MPYSARGLRWPTLLLLLLFRPSCGDDAGDAQQCGYQHASALGDDGPVLTWGMSFKKSSWQECCAACAAQAARARAGEKCGRNGRRPCVACNVWVYCDTWPACWSPDIHNHTRGECWLKRQRDPLLAPKYNARGDYPAAMRRQHRTAPRTVQWVSGVMGRAPGAGPAGSCWDKECLAMFKSARRQVGGVEA